MHPAPGVIQGDKSQAVVAGTHPVLVPAEAFGKGQDYGQGAPLLGGAKAQGTAIGLGEEYWAGKILSADTNYQSEEHLKAWAQAQLEASIPAPPFRHRDPRFAPQARPQPPLDEKVEEKV